MLQRSADLRQDSYPKAAVIEHGIMADFRKPLTQASENPLFLSKLPKSEIPLSRLPKASQAGPQVDQTFEKTFQS